MDLPSVVDLVNQWIATADEVLVQMATSPWVYVAVFLLCTIDGFFPPVPSESVVVGLSALALASGQPQLWILIIVSAAGAFLGDNIAYVIGRAIGTERFRWMRRPRVAHALERARVGLDKRGALLIFTARYIPIGRIAVNMTAGATGYPRRRFVLLTIVSGIGWSLYSCIIGVAVGHVLSDSPVIAIVVAVVFAAVLGFVVDVIVRAVGNRRDRAALTAGDLTDAGSSG